MMPFDPKRPEDLAELRRLHAETPKGPWRPGRMDTECTDGSEENAPWKAVYHDEPDAPIHLGKKLPVTVARGYGPRCRPTAAFIAAAHEAVPALLARLDLLEAQVLTYDSACLCPGEHAAAQALLRRIQWSARDHVGRPCCPVCGAYQPAGDMDREPGHTVTCALAAFIGAGEDASNPLLVAIEQARARVEEVELGQGEFAVLVEQALHAQEHHDGCIGTDWIERARSALDRWTRETGQATPPHRRA